MCPAHNPANLALLREVGLLNIPTESSFLREASRPLGQQTGTLWDPRGCWPPRMQHLPVALLCRRCQSLFASLSRVRGVLCLFFWYLFFFPPRSPSADEYALEFGFLQAWRVQTANIPQPGDTVVSIPWGRIVLGAGVSSLLGLCSHRSLLLLLRKAQPCFPLPPSSASSPLPCALAGCCVSGGRQGAGAAGACSV